jgi:hypothetical protein
MEAEASLNTKVEFIMSNVDGAAIDSLTEIITAFQNADGDINGAITALSGSASAAIAAEEAARIADVDAEEARAVSAEYSLTANLSNEVSAREAAMSTEESMRVEADASIAANLASDIEALADVDGTTIVLNGDTNQIELAESIAAPASGIRTLMGEVDIETVLKVAGVDVMSEISSEISNRIAGDASLAVELSAQVSYLLGNTDLSALDSFAEVSTELLSEVADAIAELAIVDGVTIDVNEDDNTIRLSENVAAPDSGIRTFAGLIDVAAQPADDAGFNDLSLVTKKYMVDADVSLQDGLDAEAARAEGAEGVLTASLDAEYARAVAAEGALGVRIDNVLSNIDGAALDSLTEVVAAFQAADGDINNAITNLSNAAVANLSTEVARATSCEAIVADRLNITPVVSSFTIGDGVETVFTLNHDLGTMDVIIQIYDMTTGSTVETESIRVDNQNVSIEFADAPSTNSYRVVTMGIKAFEYPQV